MKTCLGLMLLAGGLVAVAASAAPFAGGATRSQNSELRVGIRIGQAGEGQAGARVGPLQSYQSSVHRALGRSKSQRDLALASLDGDARTPSAANGEAGSVLHAAALAPEDALVQWIAANRLLAARDDENAETAIARLTHLESDNAAAWSLALALASSRQDAAGVDAALARMATSSRSDEHFVDALHAWLDVYSRNPPAAAMFLDPSEADVAPFVMGMSKAAALALPSHQALLQACDPARDGTRARAMDCAAAGRLLAHRATSISGRLVGFRLLRRLDAGFMTADDEASQRDVEWALHGAGEASGFLAHDSVAMRAHEADWRALDDEYEIMQHALRRAGQPDSAPRDWNPSVRDALAKADAG